MIDREASRPRELEALLDVELFATPLIRVAVVVSSVAAEGFTVIVLLVRWVGERRALGASLPAEVRPSRSGVRVLPLPDPGVLMTAYAVTRLGRESWSPLRLLLDRQPDRSAGLLVKPPVRARHNATPANASSPPWPASVIAVSRAESFQATSSLFRTWPTIPPAPSSKTPTSCCF